MRRAASSGAAMCPTIAAAAVVRAQAPRDRPKAVPEPGTAAIRGRVVASPSGDPVRNARVSATGEHELVPVLTDADGRFSVTSLPAGDVTIVASKPGYAKSAFGARTADGAAKVIHLDAGAIADREGRYSVQALLPGEYYAAPVSRARVDVRRDSEDPDYLGSLATGAVRVIVGEAGRVVVPLEIGER